MLKKGDRVRIKPEWQDKGDAELTWIVVEDECHYHPDLKKAPQVGIACIETAQKFAPGLRPWQRVNVSMVEKIEE